MANEEQLSILKQGVEVWNKWREENPDVEIDLRKADLRELNLLRANLKESNLSRANLSGAFLHEVKLAGANLSHANFSHADLSEALLREANLSGADLSHANLNLAYLLKANLTRANLREAKLGEAIFGGADLSKANLRRATLFKADLGYANLDGADLRETDLRRALLVRTRVNKAKASGSKVYGISVWDLEGDFEEQKDLIITREKDPVITVDNIEVAQFIYLILHNETIRDVINTLTSKSVLILGRFAIPERKGILDGLRNKLREYNLLPIVFDFDRPVDRNFTETVQTLAGLSYFVIADVTNPKSSPLELQATIPDLLVPFVPIIQEGEMPFAMIEGLQQRPWVLRTISYDSLDTLIEILKPHIIDPAIKKHDKLRTVKAKIPTIISGKKLRKKMAK